jgi:four helix bundle protein
MFNFENLKAWQKAVDFSVSIYGATKAFPDAERFGLVSQMRRASVSVSSNLAEGCARNSAPDYARFVEIAAGSLFEVDSQAFVAHRTGLLPEAELRTLYAAAEELGRMLSGLRASILRDA